MEQSSYADCTPADSAFIIDTILDCNDIEYAFGQLHGQLSREYSIKDFVLVWHRAMHDPAFGDWLVASLRADDAASELPASFHSYLRQVFVGGAHSRRVWSATKLVQFFDLVERKEISDMVQRPVTPSATKGCQHSFDTQNFLAFALIMFMRTRALYRNEPAAALFPASNRSETDTMTISIKNGSNIVFPKLSVSLEQDPSHILFRKHTTLALIHEYALEREALFAEKDMSSIYFIFYNPVKTLFISESTRLITIGRHSTCTIPLSSLGVDMATFQAAILFDDERDGYYLCNTGYDHFISVSNVVEVQKTCGRSVFSVLLESAVDLKSLNRVLLSNAPELRTMIYIMGIPFLWECIRSVGQDTASRNQEESTGDHCPMRISPVQPPL